MTTPQEPGQEDYVSWEGVTYRARMQLEIVVLGNDRAPYYASGAPRVSESIREIICLSVEGENAHEALWKIHELLGIAKTQAARTTGGPEQGTEEHEPF